MKLSGGKFYDEAGNVVPLEHGNQEQFKILERIRKHREAFEGDGLELDPDVLTKATVSFICACWESFVGMDNEDDCELNAVEGLVGQTDKCHVCGQKYILSQNDNGDIIAKFKK